MRASKKGTRARRFTKFANVSFSLPLSRERNYPVETFEKVVQQSKSNENPVTCSKTDEMQGPEREGRHACHFHIHGTYSETERGFGVPTALQKSPLAPALYLIPTPIGDEGIEGALTPSAIAVVLQLQRFAVENIRTARRFLASLDMPTPVDQLEFLQFDKHSTHQDAKLILARLADGLPIGVLSEAGAPGVADPGALLVAEAHAAQIPVKPLVGASSLLLALMASGLNGQSFAFNGYLPIDHAARKSAIARLEKIALSTGQAQLFIETPYRNDKILDQLLATLRAQTLLTVARGINSTDQFILTRTVAKWKAAPPRIGKVPTVFIIGRT